MANLSSPIEIQLANGTETETLTGEMLLWLLDDYPLDKWRYTETVRIEDNVISHCHPVLTLNTFGTGHPLRLLSTYNHEQLHWFWLLKLQIRSNRRRLNSCKSARVIEYNASASGYQYGD